MADSRKVVKVFIASPGDLGDERKTAKAVVDEFNGIFAEQFGYHVELIGWEDTVSVFGRPQDTINHELERCELFIGMMWKHWGTPPDHEGMYTSGFEEEYEISVARRLREGRPEISLLLKEIDPAFLVDPGEQIKKVLAFRDQLIAGKSILFQNFTDIREFEKKFYRCIASYVIGLKTREAGKVSDQSQAPTTSGDKQQAAETTSPASDTTLSIEGAKFLREFISKTERDAKQDPITAVEVARFRLLANLVGSRGNDESSLGVHDANLLFSKGGHFTFGHPELSELLVSGFQHYFHENVPLWHWFAAIDGFARQVMPIFSFFGPTERRVSVLTAMRLVSEPLPLPSMPHLDRKAYLNSWFAEDAKSALKVAALGYLGDCGITSDLTVIRQQLDGNDNQTINAAADAIIRINLRDSREKAILALYEFQPSSINPNVLASLFDNEAALSTEILLQGVGHQNSNVRRIVVELLRKRGALHKEMAEKMITDSDATVRYEALTSLVDAGHNFSDEEAKIVLIKQEPNRGFGLLRASDTEGEACWKHFQQQRLRLLKDKQLEEAMRQDSIFDRDPQFILAERHFKRYAEGLRKSVDDQYKAEFSQALQTMIEKFGGQTSLIEQTRSLEDHIRKGLTRQGLDVICHKAEPGDLGRVRTALKSGFIGYSAADVEYLRRYGEWEDIPLIIDAIKRPESGHSARSLLSSSFDDSKYRTAARAIYALGQTRLPKVLAMSTPSGLLPHLIIETSDKAFRSLSDVSINLLLQSENDAVRKAAALKCVKALQKVRVSKLLADYISGDKLRYYNVIHWLDFGVSIPRDRAFGVCQRSCRVHLSRLPQSTLLRGAV